MQKMLIQMINPRKKKKKIKNNKTSNPIKKKSQKTKKNKITFKIKNKKKNIKKQKMIK